MNNEFLIIKNTKNFINSLDDIVNLIPNRDRVLKDRLYNTGYDILYNLYYLNNIEDKKSNFRMVLSMISMMDFYLERCFKNKYITSKMCERKCNELLIITKMIYGWIKSESKCL